MSVADRGALAARSRSIVSTTSRIRASPAPIGGFRRVPTGYAPCAAAARGPLQTSACARSARFARPSTRSPRGDVQILALYPSAGLTCREIAVVLKVATARVHELVDQALARVREAIPGEEQNQVAA